MLQIKKTLLYISLLLYTIIFITRVCSLDPSTVDIGTKQSWCDNQQATCTNICLDIDNNDPITNYCVAETLAYDCVCSNGLRPNSSEYTQTIPYFTCTEDQERCKQACIPGDAQCINNCTKTPCAATVVNKPGKVQTTAGGDGGSTTGTGTAMANKPNPTSVVYGGDSGNFAVKISSVESGFTLLSTLIVLLFLA